MTFEERLAAMARIAAAVDAFDGEAYMKAMHPDVTLVPTHDWPENDASHGPAAVWAAQSDFMRVFGDGRFELSDPVPIGENGVLLTLARSATGEHSGVPMDYRYEVYVEFRDGLLYRQEYFHSREEALTHLR